MKFDNTSWMCCQERKKTVDKCLDNYAKAIRKYEDVITYPNGRVSVED